MAAKSPAKPWESNTSAIDSTGSNNSVLTPPTPITKHTNNPHINRAGSSSNAAPVATATTDPTVNTNTTTDSSQPQAVAQQQPMATTGYGGYGGGMYGNSMYGNSMYGGGMYGNSMYGGGLYGNSMYGGGYGGYGMNGGMYGPMGPMGPMGFMQMSVNNVGRFSQLLQVASQALHMTFSSLVQFAGNIGMLTKEFGGILSGVYVFRFLKWLYLKIKKFLFWIIGKKPSTKEQFEEMFQNAVDATSEQNAANTKSKASSTHYSWLSIGFYCFGILYIIQWIYKSITSELDQQKRLEQQQQTQPQQMMNPMNPYQQNLAFGQTQPYGYSGYYGNNMYGAQGPMMQQPQQQQTNNNQNNANDNKNSDTSANKKDDNQSESLLAKPKAVNVT